MLMLAKPFLNLVPYMKPYDPGRLSAADMKGLLTELQQSGEYEDVVEAHDIYYAGAVIVTTLAGFVMVPIIFLPKRLAYVLMSIVAVVLMVSVSLLVTRTVQSRWLSHLRPACPPTFLRPGFEIDIVSSTVGIAVALIVLKSKFG